MASNVGDTLYQYGKRYREKEKKNRNGNRKDEGEEETKRRNEDKLIYLSVIGVISYIDSAIYM